MPEVYKSRNRTRTMPYDFYSVQVYSHVIGILSILTCFVIIFSRLVNFQYSRTMTLRWLSLVLFCAIWLGNTVCQRSLWIAQNRNRHVSFCRKKHEKAPLRLSECRRIDRSTGLNNTNLHTSSAWCEVCRSVKLPALASITQNTNSKRGKRFGSRVTHLRLFTREGVLLLSPEWHNGRMPWSLTASVSYTWKERMLFVLVLTRLHALKIILLFRTILSMSRI